MTTFARLFWTQFHRSDASARFRWLLVIIGALGLMPVLGSSLSVILIGGGLVGWLYLALDHERIRFDQAERRMAVVILAYLGVALAFALLRHNPLAGLSSVANNIPFLIMLPLLPVLRSFYRESWMESIVWATIAGAAIAGIVALIEVLVFRHVRAEALTGNPLIFAYLAAVMALLNIALAFDAHGRRALYFMGAAVLASIAVFLSGGRGPLLYLLMTALLLAGFWLVTANLRQIRALLAVGLVAVAALVGGYLVLLDNRAVENTIRRFEALASVVIDPSEMSDDYSVNVRLMLYRAGLAAFAERPLTGYGLQNVMSEANAQFDDDLQFDFTQLHNAFLTEAVASGILGPITFAAVLVLPVVAAGGGRRSWPRAAVGHTIFFTLFSMTNLGFYHDIKVSHFMFIVCLLNAINRSHRPPEDLAERAQGG